MKFCRHFTADIDDDDDDREWKKKIFGKWIDSRRVDTHWITSLQWTIIAISRHVYINADLFQFYPPCLPNESNPRISIPAIQKSMRIYQQQKKSIDIEIFASIYTGECKSFVLMNISFFRMFPFIVRRLHSDTNDLHAEFLICFKLSDRHQHRVAAYLFSSHSLCSKNRQ